MTTKKKAATKIRYVTGYKVVRHDMSSIHDPNFIYHIGKEAEAFDVKVSDGECGKGIHFSPNLLYPLDFSGYDVDEGSEKEFFSLFKVLKLRVNPKDIVHKGMDKSRAKKVFVVSEVKHLGLPDYKPLIKRIQKLSTTIYTKKCTTTPAELKKSFATFIRKNKLKGHEVKIVTSPYEALWLGNRLQYMQFKCMQSIEPSSVAFAYEDCDFAAKCILDEDENDDDVIYNFEDSMSWIVSNAAAKLRGEAGGHNVEDLFVMLEAGAVPLGMAKGIVYWFAPQTTPNKWFPVL